MDSYLRWNREHGRLVDQGSGQHGSGSVRSQCTAIPRPRALQRPNREGHDTNGQDDRPQSEEVDMSRFDRGWAGHCGGHPLHVRV